MGVILLMEGGAEDPEDPEEAEPCLVLLTKEEVPPK